jgi:hypothetical protein
LKFEAPASPNYAATVIQVKTLVKLANSDNLQGIPAFGLQAITDMSTKVGDMGILFPPESQLSFEYAFENSLHSHSVKNEVALNKDPDKKGYLGDNRRVKAITLRGNRSDALFMSLSSLAYLGVKPEDFKEGDTFDKIGDHEICRKYVVLRNGSNNPANVKKGPKNRVDDRVFPEHFETRMFLRVSESLNPGAMCIVTQKLHGTSIRIGNVPVRRELSWRERLAKRFSVAVKETEYAAVYGSHHVVKDANNPGQQHFYGEDLWTTTGKALDGLVPQNYILYGEVVGYADSGRAIQPNYTYSCPPFTRRLFIYRVAVVNEQGTIVDLSWDAVKEFCNSIGVDYVPELLRTRVATLTSDDNTLEALLDVKLRDVFPQAIPLSPQSPCDEGVCIRIEDGMIPTILKAKSPLFYAHETKMIDQEAIDTEAEEAA